MAESGAAEEGAPETGTRGWYGLHPKHFGQNVGFLSRMPSGVLTMAHVRFGHTGRSFVTFGARDMGELEASTARDSVIFSRPLE